MPDEVTLEPSVTAEEVEAAASPTSQMTRAELRKLRAAGSGALPPPPVLPPPPALPARSALEARTTPQTFRRRARVRYGRLSFYLAILVAIPLIFVAVADRVSTAPPIAIVHTKVVHEVPVAMGPAGPSSVSPIPWPAVGQAAVAIPSIGYRAQSGPELPVPVASMTKVMTAYLILKDHPLTPGASGPAITITAADAGDYGTDTVSDQASIQINVGEVLTESQLLAGMLVHSANDLAFVLATWDAGSEAAFVTKMNTEAMALGMKQTHFADASGYTAKTVSTPADLLVVTGRAIANPVFAADVAMPLVTLPVSGKSYTYTPLLAGMTGGAPGVVGVKSGFTTSAGGGDILAFQSIVDGQSFDTLAAVSSQQGPNVLVAAGQTDLAMAKALAGSVRMVNVLRKGTKVGTITGDGKTVPITAVKSVSFLAVAGAQVTKKAIISRRVHDGSPRGTRIGTLTVELGSQRVVVPVRTNGPIPAPNLMQRLL